MAKRLAAILLTLVIVLGVIPIQVTAAESSTTFSDVQPNDWFATAVQYVFDKGLMMGTSSTRFSPSATTTRGQIVTILYRMEGSPEISGSCKFSDVAPESWYEKPVVWAAQNGIVNGTSKTTYAPARSITRQEMVTILYRYSTYKCYDTSSLASLDKFSDANKVSSWAVSPMKWSVAEGLISGVDSTTIAPSGTATRAQIATILMRFCDLVSKNDLHEQFKEKDIEDFPDAEVINLDNSSETNFAVLQNDTVATETNGEKNQLTELDREKGIYKFSNIDKKIAALEPGDIFYHIYGTGETDFIIAEVGTINFDGTNAEIKAANSDLADAFQYVDIDMDIEVPASSVAAYTHVDSGISLLADDEANFPRTFKFSGKMAGIDVNASAKITLHVSWEKWGIILDKIKVTVKTDSEIHADFEKRSNNKPCRIDYPSTPVVNKGVIQGTLNTFLVCNFNAGVEGHADGSLHTESGLLLDDLKLTTINECSKDFSADIKGKFDANVALGVRAKLTLLWVVDISVDTEGGLDVTGEIEKSISTQQPTEKHECTLCLEGTVVPYIQLTGYIWDHSCKPFKHSFKGSDYYLSYQAAGFDNNFEFGWGKCPHKLYLVTVTAKDKSGRPVEGQLVSVVDKSTGYIAIGGRTNSSGKFADYCHNGTYKGFITSSTYKVDPKEKEIKVSGKPVNLTFTLTPQSTPTPSPTPKPTPKPTPTPISTPTPGDVVRSGICGAQGDNLKWTLDKNGTLTITGKGEMANFPIKSQTASLSIESQTRASNDSWAGDSLFVHGIKAVNIGEGVTSIGTAAFMSHVDLTSVSLPDSLERIGNYGFAGCSALPSIKIPDGVVSIGYRAFALAENLTSLHLPKSLAEIQGDDLFSTCSKLHEITVDPRNETFLSKDGVLFVKKQDRLTLLCYPCQKQDSKYTTPEGTTDIGAYAFSRCDSLKSLTFSESVETISYEVYTDCSALSSISLPASLREFTYAYCPNLKDIFYAGSENDWTQIKDLDGYSLGAEPPSGVTIHFNSTAG